MIFVADLHVHSRFARATSRNLDLEHLALGAARKGVAVVGTGDFTHPAWLDEIARNLVPAEPGLFRLRPSIERRLATEFPVFAAAPTRFILQVETSTVYRAGGQTRRVHHLHYVSSLGAARALARKLAVFGRLEADGRPTLKTDSRTLLGITLDSGADSFLIPAHIWTPWFSVLGSKSGFDAIEECYGDLASEIFAVETGLSSDPAMNWRVSALDRFTLVSNSDAHSPGKIGREANVLNCALEFGAIREALRTGRGLQGTIEFFPEQGKYHLDGHRACGVRLDPAETAGLGGVCPTCSRPVTVGVLHRIEQLADRPNGYRPAARPGFRSLVALEEILSEIEQVGPGSMRVQHLYDQLLAEFGPELQMLETVPLDAIEPRGGELLAEALRRLRAGQVQRQPGYDGEYGVIRLFKDDEMRLTRCRCPS